MRYILKMRDKKIIGEIKDLEEAHQRSRHFMTNYTHIIPEFLIVSESDNFPLKHTHWKFLVYREEKIIGKLEVFSLTRKY